MLIILQNNQARRCSSHLILATWQDTFDMSITLPGRNSSSARSTSSPEEHLTLFAREHNEFHLNELKRRHDLSSGSDAKIQEKGENISEVDE